MARYVAGHREPREVVREVVNIDYADVLRQAVANERVNVLREVRRGIERIREREESGRAYDTRARRAEEIKRDALAVVDRVEGGAS